MGTTPSAVAARRLSVAYPRQKSPSLSDATFEIGPGITALIGRNGAGKSTLMKACVGLLRPTTGELFVTNIDMASVSQRERHRQLYAQVGYLPQEFGYVPSFTVEEFVSYGAWLKRVPPSERAGAVERAISLVDLSAEHKTRMSRLSGGMRRRAGIAQAVVHGPTLLVLDEPTTGLDPEQRVKFRELLRRMGQRCSVLLSSHLVEDVRASADRIIVIEDGQIRFLGTPAELSSKGSEDHAGDSELERGYMSVIQGSC